MLERFVRVSPVRRGRIPLLVLGLLAPVTGLSAQVLKVASLAPDGSVWDQILEEQAAAWNRESGGRLEVRIYPGGVAGDDPAVVRKMRIGQFQAAALTFQGLVEIDEGFHVFVLPLFYASEEELLYVLERLDPVLRQRVEAKGFVVLNWGYAGWARFYSKHPVRSASDLKRQKLFLWGGEERSMRVYRSHGLQPVGVAGTDVTLALQTGMIECIATPPLVALTLQWFRQVGHQLDEPLGPLVGATVITRRAWDGLDEATREAMLRASARAEARYVREVPGQEERAMVAMEERGLIRTTVAPGSRAEWDRLAAALASEFRGMLVPQDIYDLALKAREEYRARSTADRSAP